MDVADVDHELNHWRVRARAARFDGDDVAAIEAEVEIDRLLEERHALVSA